MKTPKLLLLAVLLLFAQPALAQIGTCGDYDADGVTTIGDMVAAINYLFDGAVPPDDFNRADFDLCQKLTYRDQVFIINCVFACDFWTTQCPPTNPPYTPAVNAAAKLLYPDAVPQNKSKYEIDLHLSTPNGIQAYCFPLRLRIAGAIPVIDSIRIPAVAPATPSLLNKAFINAAQGEFTLIGLRYDNSASEEPLAKIFVSTPSVSSEQSISLVWITTTPVQAPAGQEDAVFAYACDRTTLAEFYPTLTPDCCNLPGDTNNDGRVNVSDVIRYICIIFEGCWPTEICVDELDVDQSGAVSISDAVFLIAYIFAGGPAPTCR